MRFCNVFFIYILVYLVYNALQYCLRLHYNKVMSVLDIMIFALSTPYVIISTLLMINHQKFHGLNFWESTKNNPCNIVAVLSQ